MNTRDVEPRLGAESFSCPHCNLVSQQDWYSLFLKPENAPDVVVLAPEAVTVGMLRRGEREDINAIDQLVERLKKNELTYEYQKHPHPLRVKMANLHVSSCQKCNGFALWISDRLVFPTRLERAPDLAEQDLDEAAAVLDKFPTGAAALMRVCIQKLVPLLRQNDKGVDENVSSLVRKGLEVEIQQAMDVLRVLRTDQVQLTHFESKEDQEIALRFFDSLKAVLERRMLKGSGKS